MRGVVAFGLAAWALLTPTLGAAQPACAADSLRFNGPPEASAVPALIACSRAADGATETRLAAFRALASIPSPTGDVLRRLAEGMADSNPRVRKLAADALVRVGPGLAAILDTLVEALEHREPSARRSAASLLSSAGQAAASTVPALYGTLRDEDAGVREEARRAIRAVRGQ